MENFSAVRTQARTMERAGQHPAALELYGRLLDDPAGDREGRLWARAGKLQAIVGDQARATDSFATAVERFVKAEHWNLALSFCKRLLEMDETRSEFLLRFGEISAKLGYRRDAQLGYFDYAEGAVDRGELPAAIEALRAFLARFPDDDAARQRISRLTGVPEPASAAVRHADAVLDPAPIAEAPVPLLEGLEPTSVVLESPAADSLDGRSSTGVGGAGDGDAPGGELSLLGEDDAAADGGTGTPLPLLEVPDPSPLTPGDPVRPSHDRHHAVRPADRTGSDAAVAARAREYIDLGELILADAPDEETRFQVAIGNPSGNEESDFAEILDLFRRKVSENLDPKDAGSHYDLGLAFKEMGLLEDAIVHFQSALRGGSNPLATLEMLGECFVAKGQISLASRVFERATRLEGVSDSSLVGVLYGLARCQQQLGDSEEARTSFERVVAVDLAFRDASERLEELDSR